MPSIPLVTNATSVSLTSPPTPQPSWSKEAIVSLFGVLVVILVPCISLLLGHIARRNCIRHIFSRSRDRHCNPTDKNGGGIRLAETDSDTSAQTPLSRKPSTRAMPKKLVLGRNRVRNKTIVLVL
ncbi:hypothetical protein BCR34DRAFT_563487 [Clohesyomyces aquaticus]|uniref:Uncharacterized protein n=1 Tax=Clohesyomyces aquaticus TaxID=1231657 RepID=A0A1Y1ZQX7_9PLEO|nr:hypothetical protein BCR34DRAFT_563487 [Clohesyomyces aquaticus]